jgi:hypothetical protein
MNYIAVCESPLPRRLRLSDGPSIVKSLHLLVHRPLQRTASETKKDMMEDMLCEPQATSIPDHHTLRVPATTNLNETIFTALIRDLFGASSLGNMTPHRL